MFFSINFYHFNFNIIFNFYQVAIFYHFQFFIRLQSYISCKVFWSSIFIFYHLHKFNNGKHNQEHPKTNSQNLGRQERHAQCPHHRKHHPKNDNPMNVFGHNKSMTVVDINGENCHDKKAEQVDSLGKFLVEIEKNCQNGNEQRSSAHTQPAKNPRNKSCQTIQKINHQKPSTVVVTNHGNASGMCQK